MSPKFVTFVRHAEGWHNATRDHSLPDPCLTPKGIQQCNLLNQTFLQPPPVIDAAGLPPPPPPPDVLVSSPLTRTLQTTLISFSTYLSMPPHDKDKIIPLALLQETAEIPCDTGRPIELLRADFAGKGNLTGPELGNLGDINGAKDRIAWELLDPVFPNKGGIYKSDKAMLEERARLARKWLWERDEEHIVAVLHGGFLHYLTEDWTGMNHVVGTGWYNTEYRTFEFVPEQPTTDGAAVPQYSLRETEWSKLRRLAATGMLEKPLDKTEKVEYEETVAQAKPVTLN
ncbi:histidine phosphatase superfamily [Kalaharituber pfeilii]|nr:histidine phosphatase superfamily [Kalaharituber pfeilii]